MALSIESLRKWLSFMAASYPNQKELTEDQVRAYFQWLQAIPEDDLGTTIVQAMKDSPDFIPTGPKISALWDSGVKKAQEIMAEQEWERICNHVRDYGEICYKSDKPLQLSGAGEYAFRQVGGRSAMVSFLDQDQAGMKFAHQRFMECYNLHAETGGLKAIGRDEARRLLDQAKAWQKELPPSDPQ